MAADSEIKGHSSDLEATIAHEEHEEGKSEWKASSKSKSKDGDVAQALFNDPNELHEPVDPKEMRRLLWKIDFMILPYLAVCYAFFYIDKVRNYFMQIFRAFKYN